MSINRLSVEKSNEYLNTFTKLISSGAYGRVYTSKNSNEVIKVGVLFDLLKEINILIVLNKNKHPNIVQLKTLNNTSTRHFLVLPKYKSTIKHFFYYNKNNKYFSKCIHDVLSALKHLHNLNIVHADIKYNNIMITECDVNEYKAVLIDFGISKFCTIDNTYKGVAYIDSHKIPNYDIDVYNNINSDIYAFGITIKLLINPDKREIIENMDIDDRELIDDLIIKMCILSDDHDSNKRQRVELYSIDELLKHELFKNIHVIDVDGVTANIIDNDVTFINDKVKTKLILKILNIHYYENNISIRALFLAVHNINKTYGKLLDDRPTINTIALYILANIELATYIIDEDYFSDSFIYSLLPSSNPLTIYSNAVLTALRLLDNQIFSKTVWDTITNNNDVYSTFHELIHNESNKIDKIIDKYSDSSLFRNEYLKSIQL